LAIPAAAGAASGGTQWVATPQVKKVKCMKECASKRRPAPYSMLRISGSSLSGVTHVVFEGVPGKGDDAKVAVKPASDRAVRVRVPQQARTGPLRLWAGPNVRSRPTHAISIMPPEPPEPSAELNPSSGPRDPNGPQVETGTTQGKFFLGEKGGIGFAYRVIDNAPVTVEISVVRASDGQVVQTWAPATVEPGNEQTLTWDGVAGGELQPEGRYAFRLRARGGGGEAHSAQAADVQRDAFDLYHHVFPVRGRHDYGGPGAGFGSGRAGHSHQGHDVFARCGTRMVAARGGIVKFKQYHSAAGHYLVIDGDNTSIDYAYMHLVSASPFRAGDHVDTGQTIGQVGESGNARGCHLHFEMWSAPGWYDGGRPFDPLPHLQAWDSWS
jgi:murein DD-endopeptidase MepM/ murein hydrolase activator NlpD